MAFAVLFDANVLYPISLTDFFLTLAGYGLYRPHWSTEILHEVERNLLEKNPRVTADDLGYRFREMNRAYEGAAQASVIVSFNVDDFPAAACDPYDIEVQHPDVFAEHIVSLGPEAARNAINEMSERTSHPHRTSEEIIKRLAGPAESDRASLIGAPLLKIDVASEGLEL